MCNPLRFITGRLRCTTSLELSTYSQRPFTTVARTAGKAAMAATTANVTTTIGMTVVEAVITATAMATVGQMAAEAVTLPGRSITSADPSV